MHGVESVGVVGAGQMGGGIAQVAAVAGFPTVIYDAYEDSLVRCRSLHEKLLSRAVEKGRMQPEEAEQARSRISYVGSFDELAGSGIVIEAVVEDPATKKGIFEKLLSLVGAETILASNTSSISITELATAAGEAADRFIGMHFFNPVPVMKLVEVVRGLETSERTTERTILLAQAMGKTPVPANDRAGFVSNRVLMPMINEAFYAWMEGVAEPEHIDEIMKLGCNHPMGPLRLADFIGLDTCAFIMDVLAEGLNDDRYRPCPMLKQLVVAGRLGDKAGRGVYDHSGS